VVFYCVKSFHQNFVSDEEMSGGVVDRSEADFWHLHP